MNKICTSCNREFEITAKDHEFINLFEHSMPKECYLCRRKHKLAFVNYTTFYTRPNNTPGKQENIISVIDKNAPFPVYDFQYYYSDNHNPSDFFITYNFSKNFFENFFELFKICPQPALMQNLTNIDSPFVSYGSHMKNAYYCFGGMGTENMAYSMWGLKSRDSQDVLIALDCEKVYQAVFADKSFNSNYIYFSKNILDSNFMYDCRNCSNCFGCVNLRNKSYCIWNIQYTKEQYQEEIKKYTLFKKR